MPPKVCPEAARARSFLSNMSLTCQGTARAVRLRVSLSSARVARRAM